MFFPVTYYALGLTACGQTYSDTDYVAAASKLLFDIVPGAGANPNNNPICNKKVTVMHEGKSVTVKIVDRCEACAITDLGTPVSIVATRTAFLIFFYRPQSYCL